MLRDGDYIRRKKDRPSFPNERLIRFFRTTAGPYADPYPTAGQVVYAEMLRDTTFVKAAGEEIDAGTATGKFAYLGLPSGGSLPSEGTVVCAEQIGARWWMLLGGAGGSGACDTIRFQIIGSPSTNVVETVVQAVPRGFSYTDVFGISLGGVLVYDPIGCFFNEPPSQLTGRSGWAHLMVPSQAGGNNDVLNPYGEPQWEVFSLCCPAVAC